MRSRSLLLPIVCLLALSASTIHPIDCELYSESLFRGGWLLALGGFPKAEQLSILRAGERWNPASSIGDLLVASGEQFLGDRGMLMLTVGLMLASTVLLFLAFIKATGQPAFAFFLTLFASFGIASGVSDPATALGASLCVIEVLLLISNRTGFLLVLIPLHALVDGSYFLIPFYAPLFGVFQNRVLVNLVPALLAQTLLPIFGVEVAGSHEPFSISCAFVGGLLALCLSASSSSKRMPYTILTATVLLMFAALQYATQFPALALIAPLHAAALWTNTSGKLKTKWSEALSTLQSRLGGFLSPKNRIGVYWIAGAFLYFEIAVSLAHPIGEERMPGAVVDALVESHPKSVPLHSPEIGGYVGFRLGVILSPPSNYIDSASQRLSGLNKLSWYRRLFSCSGDWKAQLASLNPTEVICRGGEPLCRELRKSADWKDIGHADDTKRMENFLKQLSPKDAERARNWLEIHDWFLLQKVAPETIEPPA